MKVETGAFVARRNGKAFVTGNSGFPKSLNVSKALDRMAGAQREKVQPNQQPAYQRSIGNTRPWMDDPNHKIDGPDPVTESAHQWNGWGSALKPAWEPVVIARKPC